MRKKRVFPIVAAALLSLSMSSHVMAEPYSHVTLVVMPARYSVLQVGFDLIERQSAIMISYQGDASSEYPVLHAWNGSEWVYVSLRDYAEANFAQLIPNRTILVGGEAELPPALVEASGWAPNLLNVPSIDTAELVNSFGTVFEFRQAEWQWFAQRYNLDLNDLNEQRRTGSWYDQSHFDIQDELNRSAKDPMQLLRQKWSDDPQSSKSYVDEAVPMSEGDIFDDEDVVFDADPAELEFDKDLELEDELPADAKVFDAPIEKPAVEMDAQADLEEEVVLDEPEQVEAALPEPTVAEVVEKVAEEADERVRDVAPVERAVWDEPVAAVVEAADEDEDIEARMEEAEKALEDWETRRPSLEQALPQGDADGDRQPNAYSSDDLELAKPQPSKFVAPRSELDSYEEPEGWEERAVAEPR